jgi:hypothetical protein
MADLVTTLPEWINRSSDNTAGMDGRSSDNTAGMDGRSSDNTAGMDARSGGSVAPQVKDEKAASRDFS